MTLDACLAREMKDAKPSSILPYLSNLKCYSVNVSLSFSITFSTTARIFNWSGLPICE